MNRLIGAAVGWVIGFLTSDFQIGAIAVALGFILAPAAVELYRRCTGHSPAGWPSVPVGPDESNQARLSIPQQLSELRFRVWQLEAELAKWKQLAESQPEQSELQPQEPTEPRLAAQDLGVASATQSPDLYAGLQPQADAQAHVTERPVVLSTDMPQGAEALTEVQQLQQSPVFVNEADARAEPRQAHAVPMPAAEPLLSLTPPKPWRDRLPAPIAQFLFGGNTPVKVGGLLLFLGLAFLLRYAAQRVSLPPALRYSAVAMVGVGLLAAGWRLRQRAGAYGLILQGLGVGVLYLTTLAAMKWHQLIESGPGFGFLFAVSVLAAVLAVAQNALSLAIAASLAGFAAPVLVSSGSASPLPLYTYLAVLNAGILLMAWFKAWRPLHLIGLTCTLALASAWAEARYTPEHYGASQAFLLLFLLVYGAIGLMFARRTLLDAEQAAQADEEEAAPLAQRARQALVSVGRVDSALVFGVPIAAFALQYLLVHDKPLGPALAAMGFGLFYALLGTVAWRSRRRGLALLAEAYAIVAVLFATLAIPLALEGRWTGAAWALEAAGMYWLGQRQARPYARLFALALMFAAAWRLLAETGWSAMPGEPWLTGSALGPLMLAAATAAVWLLALRAPQRSAQAEQAGAQAAMRWEALEGIGAAAMPWLAAGGLTLLPWMLMSPAIAPAAAAAIACALAWLGQRAPGASASALASWRRLFWVAAGVHLASVLGVLAHAQGSFLSGRGELRAGPWAAVATFVVAGGILLSLWRWRAVRRSESEPMPAQAAWGPLAQVAALLASAVTVLAPAHAVDVQTLAWLWPLLALGLLQLGLVWRLTGLCVGAGAALSLAALLPITGAMRGPFSAPEAVVTRFANVYFLALTVQALSWVTAAALLWRKRLYEINAQAAIAQDVGALPSFAQPANRDIGAVWRWLALGAGVLTWMVNWQNEWEGAAMLRTESGDRWLAFAAVPAIMVLVWLATASGLIALGGRLRWREPRWLTFATVPLLAWFALSQAVKQPELQLHGLAAYCPSMNLGWLAWPLAALWMAWWLKGADGWDEPASAEARRAWRTPLAWREGSHVLAVWFTTALVACEGVGRLTRLLPSVPAWAMAAAMTVCAGVLLALSSAWMARRWPLDGHRITHLQGTAAGLAALLLGLFGVAVLLADGNPWPLVYVPLLNPIELSALAAVLALIAWQRRLEPADVLKLKPQAVARGLAVLALVFVTGAVLRTAHHWAHIPWQSQALWSSRLVHAALSITWALAGVAAMWMGHRKVSRLTWMAGAALLGVVVVKMFIVDLADQDGLYRIISFIGVGVLLLMVGYVAPAPAAARDDAKRGEVDDAV